MIKEIEVGRLSHPEKSRVENIYPFIDVVREFIEIDQIEREKAGTDEPEKHSGMRGARVVAHCVSTISGVLLTSSKESHMIAK